MTAHTPEDTMHATPFFDAAPLFDTATTDTHDDTTTIADFHLAHDTCRTWLGTLQGPTDPHSLHETAIGRQLLEATTSETFTTAVTDLLHASAEQDTGLCHLPDDGWPWPWRNSRHADWIYAFDGTRVWAAARTTRYAATPTILLPEPDSVLAQRITLLDELIERADTAPAGNTIAPGTPSRRRSRFDLVHEHVLRVEDRTAPLTDAEVAALAFALTDPMVRDACLSFATGEHAHAAEALWTQLVKAAPTPERAEPAALLAVFAYLRHDIPLATAATAYAHNAHPGHRLSELIGQAIATELEPEHLLRMAHDSQHLIEQL
ncbi:DUF4192 domain-containing protein [Saccharothrix sp. BKS2]|uniref:DUF4192 domain-containing protein n=1 Tax=Saccharothrix sp. BKS2 TaxID=3064400 RepID=UPI0039ECC694